MFNEQILRAIDLIFILYTILESQDCFGGLNMKKQFRCFENQNLILEEY